MDFGRIFIEWEYIKVQKNIINEASEAGRDHVNPPKGGILIITGHRTLVVDNSGI